MKKTKFITSSLLILSMAIVPFVSSADNGFLFRGDDNNRSIRVETRADLDAKAKVDLKHESNKNKEDKDKDRDSRSNKSILGALFGSSENRVNAEVKANSNASFNRNNIPIISGITAPTMLKVGETGTWTVNASDSSNGSLSYSVNWGDRKDDSTAKMSSESFTQTSTFTHAYANPGTYKIAFAVKNSAGLSAVSTTTVRVTSTNTVAAPVISNVSVTSTKPHQATVTWTTDVRSTSLVWYSKTSPVNTSGNANIARNSFWNSFWNVKGRDHKVTLTKLEPGTTYYVIVGSANASGKTLSSEVSVTTPALPNSSNAPVITSLTGNTSVVVGQTATITVNAYDPDNGSLTYTADWGDNTSSTFSLKAGTDVYTQTSTFTHVYDVAGTYKATFTAQNSKGLKASSSVNITAQAATQ